MYPGAKDRCRHGNQDLCWALCRWQTGWFATSTCHLSLLTWRPYAFLIQICSNCLLEGLTLFWFKYAQSSHTSQLDDSVTPGNVETWPAAKSTETFKTLAATSLLSLSLPSSHARYHVIRYFLEGLPTQLSINRLVSSPFYCTLLGANCTVYPQTTKPS